MLFPNIRWQVTVRQIEERELNPATIWATLTTSRSVDGGEVPLPRVGDVYWLIREADFKHLTGED